MKKRLKKNLSTKKRSIKKRPIKKRPIKKRPIKKNKKNKIIKRYKKYRAVDIIIPAYNVSNYITKAIDSVIKQTYKNWKLIIVDDNSTDDTYQKIIDFINKKNINNKCKILKNDKNMGCYWSINRGIKSSNNPYITILGSDDTFFPSKLKLQSNILNKYSKIIMIKCYHIRNNKHIIHGDSTLMFRRNIIKKIGYYDSVRFGADSEYMARITKVYGNLKIYIIPRALYLATSRSGSLTRTKSTRPFRRKYVNQYNRWHNSGKKLFIPYPPKKRPFAVDKIMLP